MQNIFYAIYFEYIQIQAQNLSSSISAWNNVSLDSSCVLWRTETFCFPWRVNGWYTSFVPPTYWVAHSPFCGRGFGFSPNICPAELFCSKSLKIPHHLQGCCSVTDCDLWPPHGEWTMNFLQWHSFASLHFSIEGMDKLYCIHFWSNLINDNILNTLLWKDGIIMI